MRFILISLGISLLIPCSLVARDSKEETDPYDSNPHTGGTPVRNRTRRSLTEHLLTCLVESDYFAQIEVQRYGSDKIITNWGLWGELTDEQREEIKIAMIEEGFAYVDNPGESWFLIVGADDQTVRNYYALGQLSPLPKKCKKKKTVTTRPAIPTIPKSTPVLQKEGGRLRYKGIMENLMWLNQYAKLLTFDEYAYYIEEGYIVVGAKDSKSVRKKLKKYIKNTRDFNLRS